MAISVARFACRSQLTFRSSVSHCFRKARHISSVAAVELPAETWSQTREEGHLPVSSNGGPKHTSKAPEWTRISSRDLGIKTSMIAKPVKFVLNRLRNNGYDAYLVGGCVRDLILKRTPKDFDIITSAELKEVLKTFPRCQIVGKQFPICHVYVSNSIVEVSSFSTSGRKSSTNPAHVLRKPPDCSDHDHIRWRNCLQRDFTINGLMFDPYAKIIYDYMGGLEDIKNTKVRTVVPADISFVEDCARILRAVRISARLGFHFTKRTALSIRELSPSILRLGKGRIFMEMNYMLAYGSAEDSLRLLWRFGLLEILLPFQAAYFVSNGFRRRDTRSNMLLSLFSNLDKLVAPNQPCHSCLWVGILAFHKSLVAKPRNPLVVAAFSLAVHSDGSLPEAVKIARKITLSHDSSFHELSEHEDLDTDELINDVIDLAASVRCALSEMTDEHRVSKAMRKYPQAPCSDLVFISLVSYIKVRKIFQCVERGEDDGSVPKRGSRIDHGSLAAGRLHEVRHVFARVVFDTVYPPTMNGKNRRPVYT